MTAAQYIAKARELDRKALDAEDMGDGPLADYAVSGVDDATLGTGLAGAAGVVVTLAAATAVARVAVRRRPTTPTTPTTPATPAPTA